MLIRDTLGAIVNTISNLNLKLTGYVAKDVETTFDEAYKDAFLLKCYEL